MRLVVVDSSGNEVDADTFRDADFIKRSGLVPRKLSFGIEQEWSLIVTDACGNFEYVPAELGLTAKVKDA